MAIDNNITVSGNLTKDPELRFTQTGQPNATFGIAVNRRWQNRQTNEWEEATSFFDVICWGPMAENVAQSLTRGARVIVSGRLDQRSWENQEGEKRYKIEINAEDVAPSLKFATAEVNRNARRSPDGAPAAPAHAGATMRPVANEPAAGYQQHQDEEPF